MRHSPGAASIITVVNVRTDRYDLYIGRANVRYHLPRSKWHNPFRIGPDGTREQVLEKYRSYILGRPDLLAELNELRGRTLGCWCAPPGGLTADEPLVCHGQILASLVNRRLGERAIPDTSI
jgi:hypothetical protein